MKTTRWDIQNYIKTPETQLAFLEAVLEDGDPHLIASALGDIAKARGMSIIPRESGPSRMKLCETLEALAKELGMGSDRLKPLLGPFRG